MILGIRQQGRSTDEMRQMLLEGLDRASTGAVPEDAAVWADDGLALCCVPEGLATMDEGPQPFASPDGDVTLFFQGKIYNGEELERSLDHDGKRMSGPSGRILIDLYRCREERFLERVNGKFAFALWDGRDRTLLLARDRMGIEPLFYLAKNDRLMFGTSLRTLSATGWFQRELNEQAILQYLLFCYNPDRETFLRGVYKLPAGHLLRADPAKVSLRRYWQLSFAETENKSEDRYAEEILDLIEDAVRVRTEPAKSPGIFLSGGTDSSTLVSLTSRLYDQPLNTFSFRCRGKSFDESSWAQFVADRFGTRHEQVSFDAHSVGLIEQAVRGMDEPLCDIGIEIGTYLLGRAAGGRVCYVFSGEGGDEAFAGHPVYQADKLAALVDWIPGFLIRPLMGSLQKLRDSDQKKNLQVKVKRFAYSMSFPRALLSHRWRTYYTLAQLRQLCTEEFLQSCELEERYASILHYNNEADGGDLLSRSLYSDYMTLVDFYLRRLQLLRTFSVESRLPLLDHRLVEYAARIPSRLKVHGFSETKYLYRKALERIVPREILYGRPKLGHSVPLKNWLREDAQVRRFIGEHLSEESLRERGMFRAETVGRMMEEHTERVDNHSHRLWALLVLELWLKAHLAG